MIAMLCMLIIFGIIVAFLYHMQAAQVIGYGLVFILGACLVFFALPIVMIVVMCCVVGVVLCAVVDACMRRNKDDKGKAQATTK